jgi:phosphatidylserine/phosphatidylglycerophosphate/cardiolipin synthase-like enzyme
MDRFRIRELNMQAERFVFTANQRASSVLRVIGGARERLVLSLFRCDDFRILDAIGAALQRGVDVAVLVTSRAKGGAKRLDELWGVLENMGAKYLVADDGPALVASLNFTRRCFTSTCDFLLTTHDPVVVGGLRRLFAADSRGPESAPPSRLGNRLIVGPEHARRALTGLLEQARRSIRIVDPKVTDPAIVDLLKTKRAEGVEVTVLGREGLRQHVPHGKMLLVDEAIGVLGSLSLSALSLDFRREVAVVVHDPQCLEQMNRVFRRLASGPAPGRARPVN